MSITAEHYLIDELAGDELASARSESVPSFPQHERFDSGPAPAPARKTWEYRTVFGGSGAAESVERLNAVGADGWELVSVMPPYSPQGQTILYLKRERRV